MEKLHKVPVRRTFRAWMNRGTDDEGRPIYKGLTLIPEGASPGSGHWVPMPWLDVVELRLEMELDDDGGWTGKVPAAGVVGHGTMEEARVRAMDATAQALLRQRADDPGSLTFDPGRVVLVMEA